METASLLNRVAAAATVMDTSGATAAAAWPFANIQRPEEPLLTWRSTVATTQQINFDFGAPVPIGLVGLVNVNFTLAYLYAASNASFTANVVSHPIVPRQCPSGRYQCGDLWPTEPLRRYFALQIPTQTPVDGASYFSVGGLCIGAATEFPVSLGPDLTIEVHEPALDVAGIGGGAGSRLDVGAPYVTLTCRRFGDVGKEEGIDDEWGAWTAFDSLVRAAGHVGVFLDYGNQAHFWVMRRASPLRWAYTYPQVSDTIKLDEVIAP